MCRAVHRRRVGCVEFRLLGPLEVSVEEGLLDLGGPRQREVLAHLLARVNHVVTPDRLIDEIWGESPPPGARKSLQSYVSRLRGVIGPSRIESRAHGYVLVAEPDEVDALRFEALVAEARAAQSNPEEAARALREALALWRGRPFEDLPGKVSLSGELNRLEELRLSATEDWVGAELSSGRHLEVVPELEVLLAAHPLRERFWAQLMLALYRSGRQAEALSAFARARRILSQELGIEPSSELRRLEEQILVQDSALELAQESSTRVEDGRFGQSPMNGPPVDRKVATLLFADVSASGAPAQSDPEDLLALLQPIFQAMSDEFERFGGFVTKRVGHALIAVFGVPVAFEDHPARALRAALSLQRRMAELSAEGVGFDLSLRIGVSTGDIVAMADLEEGNRAVIGETVNEALRMGVLARPGSIVVGERTYRDARQTFYFHPLGELNVTALGRPSPAWELEGERSADQQSMLRRAPLVGRRPELNLLRSSFRRCVAESASKLVTVMARAGVGKSRLALELRRSLEGEQLGIRVVQGHCLPYGDGLTYWPLAEILKADADILDSDPAGTIVEKAVTQLGARMGEEATGTSAVLLASIGIATATDPLAGLAPAAARELIARSWSVYFESMTSEHPLLAIIEDLHWADTGLLDVIESLQRHMDGPMMLFCLSRPELYERRPTWGSMSDSDTLVLSPLTEEQSGMLVKHLLGSQLPLSSQLRAVLGRAEGNPFFLEELIRMLIDEGRLGHTEEEWGLNQAPSFSLPDTVQGVIASRIDRLAPAEKRVLQDAAVVGRTFWQGAIEHLGSPGLGAVLEALIRKGLIHDVERSLIAHDRELMFTHVLTRDVAYGSIPRSQLTEAHSQTGRWVEQATAGRSEEFSEILAYHFERGGGDFERAARYAMLAGHRKQVLYLTEEALAWYERALQAAERLDVGETRIRLEAEIMLSRGQSKEVLTRFREAQADYERAASAARAARDGRLEAEALAALAHIYRAQADYEEGRPVLNEALDRARSVGASDLVIRILYTAGASAFDRAEWEESLGFHEQALLLAESEGDLEGEAFARHGLCDTRWALGPFEDTLAQGLRASEVFRSLGHRHMLYHNEYMVGHMQWILGQFAEADRTYDSCLSGTRRLGSRWDEALTLGGRSNLRLSQGHLGEAVADAIAAMEVLEGVGSPRIRLVAMSLGILNVLAELHAFPRLKDELATARKISDELGTNYLRPRLLSCQGWMELRSGHKREALSLFDEARAACGPALWENLWTHWFELLAWEDARSAVGVRETARRIYELAHTQSPPFLAWGQYGLALSASLEGEWESAAELATTACSAADSIGERPVAWRAGLVAAQALSALGRREKAAARRAQAAEIVEEIVVTIADPQLRDSFLGRADVAELRIPSTQPSQ